MSLRSKLVVAFFVVLLPVLALIVYDYSADYRQWSKEIGDDQLRTSQAIGVLADSSIDDAFSVAWSLSKNPVVQTRDSRQVDPYLESFAQFLPQFDDVAVFDLEGRNVGSMVLHLPPDASRPTIADRAYFQQVKTTSQPVISGVLISKATSRPIAVVAVPMFDGAGALQGITIATLDIDRLAQRVASVGPRQSRAIFMTDPEGRVAFYTGLPREDWGSRTLEDFPPVRMALSGFSGQYREISTPLGSTGIVGASRTAKYGWIVGVSVPSAEALQPLRSDLIRRLVLFGVVLAFASFVAGLASRSLILHPLQVLRDHLIAFGQGQLWRRVDLKTGDEMELVASTLNQMASQLQEWSHERETLLQETIDAHQALETVHQRREEFISMVTHDLRNPLAVMVGYAELVSDGLRKGKKLEPQLAEKIIVQVGRVRRLVEDMSTASLIEAGRFKVLKGTCDLWKMACDVVEQQQMMATKHEILLDAPAKPVVGEWDCDRLSQALNNLVNNAVKYSPQGGEIRLRLAPNSHEVTVSVSDQGVGIAPEDIPHLFRCFSRVDEGRCIRGTGLGLYITKAIVEAHGGRFWVESEKDKGSTFSFVIPQGTGV